MASRRCETRVGTLPPKRGKVLDTPEVRVGNMISGSGSVYQMAIELTRELRRQSRAQLIDELSR
jgi:hypothetical protein